MGFIKISNSTITLKIIPGEQWKYVPIEVVPFAWKQVPELY